MAASGQGRQEAGKNYVAQDEIWRSHVEHEQHASRRWGLVWSFLAVKDKPKKESRAKVRLPTPLQVQPPTPISEYIEVGPSPRPFPETTTNEVGWRSSQGNLSLERYGKYARSKANILKTFNWPNEASV